LIAAVVSREGVGESLVEAPSGVERASGGGLRTLVLRLMYCDRGSSPRVVPPGDVDERVVVGRLVVSCGEAYCADTAFFPGDRD
jgi:hypothetical protein